MSYPIDKGRVLWEDAQSQERQKIIDIIKSERLIDTDSPNAEFIDSSGRREDQAYNRAIDDILESIEKNNY